MSYRAAWGKIKATEEKLGCKLLNNSQGAKGFRLTDIGENLLESFDRFQEEVEQFAMKKAKDAFPWKVQNFQASNEPPEE